MVIRCPPVIKPSWYFPAALFIEKFGGKIKSKQEKHNFKPPKTLPHAALLRLYLYGPESWYCVLVLIMFVLLRDTAGQERFRTITTAYYRGAMVSAFYILSDTRDINLFRAVLLAQIHEFSGSTRLHRASCLSTTLQTRNPLTTSRTGSGT